MPSIFPYPGLRPFQPDQSDIFFGREEQTDELLRKLSASRFLGVVGPSGCGKSSLIMAGMIPALESGFMVKAGSRWKIAIMRPGEHPLNALTAELLKTVIVAECANDYTAPFLEATLRRGPLGLVEALRETPLPPDTNLFLLVDQFEELFRLRNDTNRDEGDAFVALLLETALQREVPIYVVITMRSDYLGNCALFPRLPEALNKSQYLTPRMTREERQSAIMGPARVFGGDITPDLVNTLLNETGADPNQLPVLQHILMRMWRLTKPTKVFEPDNYFYVDIPSDTLGHVLTMKDYENVGGISKALSKHADEALERLNDEEQIIAEKIFQCLTERKNGQSDGRHPATVSEIREWAQASIEKVITVVEVFRSPEYAFLTSTPPGVLDENTVIDISHESLIVLWEKLIKWVKDEAESADIYRDLERTAYLWDRKWCRKNSALWRSPKLDFALSWKKKEMPSPLWAKRYGDYFDLAMKFLNTSERHHLKRKRLILGALSFFFILIGGSPLAYLYLKEWPHAEYYASFVSERGIPVGISKQTRKQRESRTVSFKIVKKGFFGDDKKDIISMETVNGIGDLTPYNNVETYFDLNLESSQSQACKWLYTLDEDKENIMYEQAYNKQGKLVWTLIYSPLSGDKDKREVLYLGPESISMSEEQKEDKDTILENRTDSSKDVKMSLDQSEIPEIQKGDPSQKNGSNDSVRKQILINTQDQSLKKVKTDFENIIYYFSKGKLVNLEYDKNGYERKIKYFDIDREPTSGPHQAYEQKNEFNNGLLIKSTFLDINGEPFVTEDGYAAVRWKHDEDGNKTREEYLDVDGKTLVKNNYGYAGIRWGYDYFGNKVKEEYLDVDGKTLVEDKYYGCAGWTAKYDEKGNMTYVSIMDINGKAFISKDGYAAVRMEYDEDGNTTREEYLGVDGKTLVKDKYYGYAGWTAKYDKKGNKTYESYLDTNGNAFINEYGYAAVRWYYDEDGNTIREEYLDVDGKTLVRDKYYGYAAVRWYYGEDGNTTREEYLDVDGKTLVKDKYYGYAAVRWYYDEDGNKTREEYLDVDGKTLVKDKYYGYAAVRWYYDEDGNTIREEYLDVDGKTLIKNDYGYAGIRWEYDYFGNKVKEEYLNVDGKTLVKDKYYGYAGWTAKYDKKGNKTYESYLDTNGNAFINEYGYAAVRMEYDEDGNTTREEYLDVDGKTLIKNDYGYAGWTAKYDEKGNMTYVSIMDINGKAFVSEYGYAAVRREYDEDGNTTREEYLGVDGKTLVNNNYGYAGWTAKYDKKGNKTYESYLDTNRNAFINEYGYAAVRREYDEDGNTTREEYLGVDGKTLIKNKYGYAGWIAEYDDKGNIIHESYFDEKGKAVSNEKSDYTIKLQDDYFK